MFLITVRTTKHKNYSYTVSARRDIVAILAWHHSFPTTLSVEVSTA